jgi:hypothetical protein
MGAEGSFSGGEANPSPPCSAEAKNTLNCTSTPPIRLHGVVLSEAQGQFYLVLPLVITHGYIALLLLLLLAAIAQIRNFKYSCPSLILFEL